MPPPSQPRQMPLPPSWEGGGRPRLPEGVASSARALLRSPYFPRHSVPQARHLFTTTSHRPHLTRLAKRPLIYAPAATAPANALASLLGGRWQATPAGGSRVLARALLRSPCFPRHSEPREESLYNHFAPPAPYQAGKAPSPRPGGNPQAPMEAPASCTRAMRRYSPSWAISSSWVPRCTMRPFSSTKIRSAFRIVDSR